MTKPTPSSPTSMTPDQVAEHLATLQTQSTSSVNQPLQKRIWSLSRTGLQGKTLWDWLQVILIPLVLTASTLTFMQQQNSLADEQFKSQVLQNYTSLIQDLILHEGLLQSKPGDNVRTIARTQTDLAFRQLDKDRKINLLLFISQLNLTDSSNPFINLAEVHFGDTDLSGANLSSSKLGRVKLGRAKLREAKLNRADLSGTDLSYTNLSMTKLNEANLSGANLSGSDLVGVSFGEVSLLADLSRADLSRVNLARTSITNEQLKQAKSLQGATMPDGSKHP